MNKNPLLPLRTRITELDNALLELLAERRHIVLNIVKTKIDAHLPIRDLEREKILLKQLVHKGETLKLDAHYITRVYQLIIEDSVLLQQRALQRQVNHDTHEHTKSTNIAFLGPKGSYSHMAMRRYAASHIDHFSEFGCKNFTEIFQQIENGHVDIGVVPIENTSSGSINEIYDLLQQTNLSIIDELKLPIEHCILSTNPQATFENITTIYSHPQPFQQCSQFLSQFPEWNFQYCDSTSSAMQHVAQQKAPDIAAIGNKDGGELYGLHAIHCQIANQTTNITRFIVLSRKSITVSPEVPAKTTLLLATGQQAGALVDVLLVLRKHNIMMTKLESRPINGNPWEEMFYIDMLVNLDSPMMQTALKELNALARFVKVLGCYPSDAIVPVSQLD